MNLNSQSEVLDRISAALEAADAVFRKFTAGAIEAEFKALKDGNFALTGQPTAKADKGKGKKK